MWGLEDTREDVEILLSESDTESSRDELKEEREHGAHRQDQTARRWST